MGRRSSGYPKCQSRKSMAQPARFVAVITGCSQGLGFHAAAALAQADSTTEIIFACRNVGAARAAAASVLARKHAAIEASRLVVLDEPLNLDDVDSVRAYGERMYRY